MTFLEALLALTTNSEALQDELHKLSKGFLAIGMMSRPEIMRERPERRTSELAFTIISPILQKNMFKDSHANPCFKEKDTAAIRAWGQAAATLQMRVLGQLTSGFHPDDLQQAVQLLKVRAMGG